jgi:hypothetical protein
MFPVIVLKLTVVAPIYDEMPPAVPPPLLPLIVLLMIDRLPKL